MTLKGPSLKVISPSVWPDMTLVTASATLAAIALDYSSSLVTYVRSMTQVICSKILSHKYHAPSISNSLYQSNSITEVNDVIQTIITVCLSMYRTKCKNNTAHWYFINNTKIYPVKQASLDSILSLGLWANRGTLEYNGHPWPKSVPTISWWLAPLGLESKGWSPLAPRPRNDENEHERTLN